jgi:DNA-binding MarR family transcriptional regulator
MPGLSDITTDSREVMNAIRRIIHALQVGSHAAQKSIGLSGAQLFLLQILASGEVMSVNELASRSCTHQSSVSVVVSRLVAAKLLKRSASAADGRRLDLSVTPAGRRLLKSRIVTPQERIIAVLARMEPSRLRDLRLLLEEVIAESGLDSGPIPMFFEEKLRRTSGAKSKKGRGAQLYSPKIQPRTKVKQK